MAARRDIRNVAIIAHVDHGKTTLVDAMLWQSGVFPENEYVQDRVSTPATWSARRHHDPRQERRRHAMGGRRSTSSTRPGHADFGGEVERGLTMVDGVPLLVDASEGPLPQTRFVLRKALELHLHVVLVVNKIDRPDARIAEVVDEVYAFLDLDAADHQIEFPIVYTNARAGRRRSTPASPATTSSRSSTRSSRTVPPPSYDEAHPLQALVTNLDASPYRRPPRALPHPRGVLSAATSVHGAATTAPSSARRSPSST